MSAPLPHYVPVLRRLPDYEPDEEPEGRLLRWSSLQPAVGPQLELVRQPDVPVVPPQALWRLVAIVLEVLDGRRQVGQLRTLLPDQAYEALLTRLRTTVPGARHQLRRLRACYPSEVAVELTAVVEVVLPGQKRGRVFAAAGRFELHRDAWRCLVLRML
jgi:hypothetical protein